MTDLCRHRLYLRAWLDAEGTLPDPAVAPVRLAVRTAGSIPPKADMARAGYIVVVWTWRARAEVAKADIEAWEEAHIAAIRDDEANPEVPMTDEAGNPIASAEGGAVPARRKVNYHGTVLAKPSVFAPPGRTLQSLWGAWGEGRQRLERILTVRPEFLTDARERSAAATIHAMRLMMEGEPTVTIIDPSLPL